VLRERELGIRAVPVAAAAPAALDSVNHVDPSLEPSTDIVAPPHVPEAVNVLSAH